MTTFLMVLTMLAAVALLAALAYYAWHIAVTLEAIGNREPADTNHGGAKPSLLSRIAFGVGAIEHQLGALPPQATRLNENLEKLAGGMVALKTDLKGALEAVERQGRV